MSLETGIANPTETAFIKSFDDIKPISLDTDPNELQKNWQGYLNGEDTEISISKVLFEKDPNAIKGILSTINKDPERYISTHALDKHPSGAILAPIYLLEAAKLDKNNIYTTKNFATKGERVHQIVSTHENLEKEVSNPIWLNITDDLIYHMHSGYTAEKAYKDLRLLFDTQPQTAILITAAASELAVYDRNISFQFKHALNEIFPNNKDIDTNKNTLSAVYRLLNNKIYSSKAQDEISAILKNSIENPNILRKQKVLKQIKPTIIFPRMADIIMDRAAQEGINVTPPITRALEKRYDEIVPNPVSSYIKYYTMPSYGQPGELLKDSNIRRISEGLQ